MGEQAKPWRCIEYKKRKNLQCYNKVGSQPQDYNKEVSKWMIRVYNISVELHIPYSIYSKVQEEDNVWDQQERSLRDFPEIM